MIERVNLNFFNLQKMIVIVFIICFSAVSFFYFNNYRAKARDVKRRADAQIVMKALDAYHEKHGFYPQSANEFRGWDMSYSADGKADGILKILKDEDLIDRDIRDPLNTAFYHYHYQKYPAGSFGCSKPFYIFQVMSFETDIKGIGMGKCNEYDWSKLAPYGYTLQGYD